MYSIPVMIFSNIHPRPKIGLSDKLLGRGDAKKKQLLDAIEEAKKLDKKEYQDALTSYQNEYEEWQTVTRLSTKILAGDMAAYIEAIKNVDPFPISKD